MFEINQIYTPVVGVTFITSNIGGMLLSFFNENVVFLTQSAMITVAMNERVSQSAFSTLSVNGITSCDSSIIVSFIIVLQMSFIHKFGA